MAFPACNLGNILYRSLKMMHMQFYTKVKYPFHLPSSYEILSLHILLLLLYKLVITAQKIRHSIAVKLEQQQVIFILVL